MNRQKHCMLLAFTALLLCSLQRQAHAWDSICYRFEDATLPVSDLDGNAVIDESRGCEGAAAARGRFRDPVFHYDEHRQLFALAAQRLGLPASVLDTQSLNVLTSPATKLVASSAGQIPSIDPLPPQQAGRAVQRPFALDELAQLPDMSFNVWDLLRGNETCPLALQDKSLNDAERCHSFRSHMGATNSSHFPPQSDAWFGHYHLLATERAAQCRAIRSGIWAKEPEERRDATDARLASFFRACEVEALVYEAVAQHFLQDGWSSGHSFQRWGSTNLADFPDVKAELTPFSGSKDLELEPQRVSDWNAQPLQTRQLLIAELVAIAAGTIHGIDAPVYDNHATRPASIGRDAMCGTNANVIMDDRGTLLQMGGDLYLDGVLASDPSALGPQRERLLSCAAGALGDVYARLADSSSYGAPVLGAATALPSDGFSAENCRAPRATNRAMFEGINGAFVMSASFDISMTSGGVVAAIPLSITKTMRSDYSRLRAAAETLAKFVPNGTSLSTLQTTTSVTFDEDICESVDTVVSCNKRSYPVPAEVYTMLRTEPNRCYDVADGDRTGCSARAPAKQRPSPLADQTLQLPLDPHSSETPAAATTLAFHASRAADLCNVVQPADLQALPGLVSSADVNSRTAACEACVEWTAPFLRVGHDPDDYDTTAEPLCYFAASDPASVPYIYQAPGVSSDTTAAARRRCGCETGLVAVTDAGLVRLRARHAGTDVTLYKTGATVPLGRLPRGVAPASAERLIAVNSAGEIVGVRGDSEIDLDGDDSNGITRVTLPNLPDLYAVTVVNSAGRELVLAVSSSTAELIAWDLNAHELCDRFPVKQSDGQGAYAIATSPDGADVYVSLRTLSPVSGAVAVVSLPDIADCNSSAKSSISWLTLPAPAAGAGPLAISPDGSKLAVGARLGGTCLDFIRTANLLDPLGQIEVQVGCDRVFVYDREASAWVTFGDDRGVSTRPGRFPYAVAWFGDSTRFAYAAFQGLDATGNGDSGWPMMSSAAPRIPVGGTLRLADISGPSFSGGGGVDDDGNSVSRYWSYNIPLDSSIAGPNLVVEDGASGKDAWVYVGTASGRVSGFRVAPSNTAVDPFWEGARADPETDLHLLAGAWYGGCSHYCGLTNSSLCPMVCTDANQADGFGAVELGSFVRALVAF